MNYSSSGRLKTEEGVGAISNAEIERRGAGKARTFRLPRMMAIIFLTVIWCSAVWAQTESGQTVATIPAKDGELVVQNGTNNDVWLVAGNERVAVNAEEALRVAGWIKEGKTGDYGDTGSARFRRESSILVVTFAAEKPGQKELRLEDAEALQLAAALASGARTSAKQGNDGPHLRSQVMVER